MIRSKIALATLVLFVSLLGGCAAQVTTERVHSTDSWVSTWGASQVAPAANAQGFNNQTLRLIVHTTIGGDQVRIRIANTFGARPISIGAASVALQVSGAAVAANTNRVLSFGGRASITVPPGAVIVSDSVKLEVPSQRNLAVSIFLANDTGPATTHPLATQTSFASNTGNFVANNDAAPFTTTLQTWPFLSSVEVHVRNPVPTLVTFGDSITDGFKSTVDANHRWPDYFANRLFAAGKSVAVVNEAISGNRMWHDAAAARPMFGPNGLARFDRDVLTVSGVSHVVVMLGINDIGMASVTRNPEEQVGAEDLIVGLRQMATRAHARGLKIYCATLTPYGRAAYSSVEGEVTREAVNRWIRTNKEFDGVIDFDAAVRDPSNPTQFLALYDSGDHLHPSDAGYKAMAESVDLRLFE